MANILDYVKKYGKLTHKQKEFNELDYLILSIISYIDFDGIISSSKDGTSLFDAAIIYFKKYSKLDYNNNIIGVRSAIDTFECIYRLPRYKDLILYNYCYKRSDVEQFSSVFIDISKSLTFISFEGTDDLIVGWKEDAELAYKFPIASHKDAIKYLNKNINPFKRREYILGGHSKGGNLALVAGMYANSLNRPKIKYIYNFDGPGLKEEQMNSRFFRRIKNKYFLVVPNYTIIGVLLYHPNNMKVVKSDHIGIIAHNCLYWQIEDDCFIETELSDFSKRIDKAIVSWLKKYSDEEKKQFVDDLFMIFTRANIDSLIDVKLQTLSKILSILKETNGLSKESKNMINSLVKFLYNNLKDMAVYAIKNNIYINKH